MIEYEKVAKYQLTRYYAHVLHRGTGVYSSDTYPLTITHDKLFIHSGYGWDGPSGPAIDTASFMRASLVHDALYDLIRQRILPKKYRKYADKEMRLIAIEDGMPKIRAWWTYQAVRLFGGKHSK